MGGDDPGSAALIYADWLEEHGDVLADAIRYLIRHTGSFWVSRIPYEEDEMRDLWVESKTDEEVRAMIGREPSTLVFGFTADEWDFDETSPFHPDFFTEDPPVDDMPEDYWEPEEEE